MSRRLEPREGWILLGVLAALVAVAVPQLGSDPWPFRPPSVHPHGLLGPVVNFAQTIGLPIDDVDKTTPGVPSVVYGVILLLVLFLLPNGAAGLGQKIASLTKRVL